MKTETIFGESPRDFSETTPGCPPAQESRFPSEESPRDFSEITPGCPPAAEKKLLGVIGGLGPMATAVFLERIVRFTDAATDQEHLDIAIRHCPTIPDRTAFILGRSSDDPRPQIIREGRYLAQQGACCIAIPCVTAHSFQSEIEQGTGLPVIDTVSLTARALAKAGVSRAAIWATEGTMHTGLFTKALRAFGIDAIVPDERVQSIVTDCIYRDIKTGREPNEAELAEAKERMLALGAQAIILGCTELSVAAQHHAFGPGFIDALDVLARACVETCGGAVRPQYQTLFTPIQR